MNVPTSFALFMSEDGRIFRRLSSAERRGEERGGTKGGEEKDLIYSLIPLY